MSNYLTHRDANHGECAQPCRWKYKVVEEFERATFADWKIFFEKILFDLGLRGDEVKIITTMIPEPQQMAMLPRKYWHLTNNGFLMECFYIHKHILFFKYKGGFVLGAPARVDRMEEMCAAKYGCKIPKESFS